MRFMRRAPLRSRRRDGAVVWAVRAVSRDTARDCGSLTCSCDPCAMRSMACSALSSSAMRRSYGTKQTLRLSSGPANVRKRLTIASESCRGPIRLRSRPSVQRRYHAGHERGRRDGQPARRGERFVDFEAVSLIVISQHLLDHQRRRFLSARLHPDDRRQGARVCRPRCGPTGRCGQLDHLDIARGRSVAQSLVACACRILSHALMRPDHGWTGRSGHASARHRCDRRLDLRSTRQSGPVVAYRVGPVVSRLERSRTHAEQLELYDCDGDQSVRPGAVYEHQCDVDPISELGWSGWVFAAFRSASFHADFAIQRLVNEPAACPWKRVRRARAKYRYTDSASGGTVFLVAMAVVVFLLYRWHRRRRRFRSPNPDCDFEVDRVTEVSSDATLSTVSIPRRWSASTLLLQKDASGTSKTTGYLT